MTAPLIPHLKSLPPSTIVMHTISAIRINKNGSSPDELMQRIRGFKGSSIFFPDPQTIISGFPSHNLNYKFYIKTEYIPGLFFFHILLLCY